MSKVVDSILKEINQIVWVTSLNGFLALAGQMCGSWGVHLLE
jgi:hypothetical protein